jgi:hypothetical protein
VHLGVQLHNARSQQNKIWQAGENRRRLEAANEKGLHMGTSRSPTDVPIS